MNYLASYNVLIPNRVYRKRVLIEATDWETAINKAKKIALENDYELIKLEVL